MATNVGRVGIVMKGTWSSSATYEELDAVSYNNGLYIAKQAVPANTAPTNTTYWQVGIDPSVILPVVDTFIAPKNDAINLGVAGADYTLSGGKVYMLFNSSNVSGLGVVVRTNSQKVVSFDEILTSSGFVLAQDGNYLKITNATNYDFAITIYRMT